MDPLSAARALIEAGVPVFIAKKSPQFPKGGSSNLGYTLPPAWQSTKADESVLDKYNGTDALCAVMGHEIDVLDFDPRNGGKESYEKLKLEGLPKIYGRQSTPSGGFHLLIAPLGEPSKDGLLPGLDYKGGNEEGKGRGFIFLGPTKKLSKETGEISEYTWELEPDLSGLLIEDDLSGAAVKERIRESRKVSSTGLGYDGPVFKDLKAERQEMARDYFDNELQEWMVRLNVAETWVEGERDHRGRGWEALVRDAAWWVAKMAVAPWSPLEEGEARFVFDELIPDSMAADAKCRGKWYEGILEKASADGTPQPPWWAEAFFESTSTLLHIQQAAHAGLVSPESMLCMLLGRVLAEVPPEVVLPAIGGLSAASLNLGIAMTGPSGSGKSSTIKGSRALLGMVGLEQKNIEEGMGSGEGMLDLFLEAEKAMNDKGEMKPTGNMILKDDPRVILMADEIEQMAAVGADRKGSTLNSLLRSALTGEALKIANSKAGGRYRSVPESGYRMVVVVGVQPERSDVLLSAKETAVGTPQRFLWCSLLDPNRPKNGRPKHPGALDWTPPKWPKVVDYPSVIEEEIIDAKERMLDGKAKAWEGHILLTRLKVAFALAALHGESKITEQWWKLAAILTERSLEVQRECKDSLTKAMVRQFTHSEIQRAKAKEEAEGVVSEDRLAKAAEAVVTRLKKSPGEELQWNRCKPAFRLREGLDTEEIIEAAKGLGATVIEYDAQGRTAFRLVWKDAE